MGKRQRESGGGDGECGSEAAGAAAAAAKNKKNKKNKDKNVKSKSDGVDSPGDSSADPEAGPAAAAPARAGFRFGPRRDARITVSQDGLAVTGFKGYRSAMSSHAAPVGAGAWFCEMIVERLAASDDPRRDGHVRLGWAAASARTDAPVGFCKAGYGFRSMDGSKVHDAWREEYAADGLVEGDVLGMLIHLGGETPAAGSSGRRQRRPKQSARALARTGSSGSDVKGVEGALPPHIVDSFVQFFRNGVDLGVAFRSLTRPAAESEAATASAVGGDDGGGGPPASTGTNVDGYFVVASLYQDATVRLNPGPDFRFPPKLNKGQHFRRLSELADEAATAARSSC